MPAKKQGTHLELVLTPDSSQNVLLIRGPPDNAPLTRLTGKIVVHSNEALTAKKVTLRLVGTMSLKWEEQGPQQPRAQTGSHIVRYEKTAFEQEIDLSEILSAPGSRPSSNPSSGRATPSAGGSMSNLASYFSAAHSQKSPAAASPHGQLSRTSSSLSLHLPSSKKDIFVGAGVHQVPFEMVVPGNVPESIEGNDNARIVYWLIATVERGRFQHNLVGRKHIRIMRTLAVDTYDAAQSISIENVWPKKVEYTIEVPSKAVPIGGSADVHFSLQPLQKGLSIGKVKMSLIQSLVMHLPTTQSTTISTAIVETTYKAPEVDSEDLWTFVRTIVLPTSLSKVTPDCLIQPNVKVTHKLKVVVALKNADGHTSELRASLPVTLFVSPRIPVVASEIDISCTHGVTNVIERPGDEGLVFATAEGRNPDDEDGAPPNYRNHIYDRLFSEVATPMTPSSPAHSGGSTPAWRGDSLNSLNAVQHEQLTSRLRALQLSRENETLSPHSSTHLPMSNIGSNGTNTPPIDVQTLSRVPSYDHALHDMTSADAAPDYD